VSQSTLENANRGIKPLQLIFILATLQFVIAFFTDPMMLTFDESMWHYIGRNWIRNGLTPYSGGIDNKSPLIFYIFGLSDWLFGVNYWFPRLIGIIVQSVGIFYLLKIAEKTIGNGAGIFAAGFYGLSLLWKSTGGKYVSYTETYEIAAIILSVYFVTSYSGRYRSFIAGIFGGIGFGFRITAIFGAIPIICYLFKTKRRDSYYFIAGFLSSVIILFLIAELAGIRIGDIIFYGFTDNFGTGSATDHSWSWKIQRFGDEFFDSEIILFYPAVIYYFIFVRKFTFLKGWLFSEFLGILTLGVYDRTHFKELLPVLSLISAYSVNHLVTNYGLPSRQIYLGMWIMFFPKTFEPIYAIKNYFISGDGQKNNYGKMNSFDGPGSKRLVGLWIKSRSASNAKVYVAGYGSEIQVYSERVSPAQYFNITQTSFAKRKLFTDLSSNKPDLMVIPATDSYSILVDRDVRHFISDLAATNYTLDTCIYNYNILRYKNDKNP
jgi:hypothetical protein